VSDLAGTAEALAAASISKPTEMTFMAQIIIAPLTCIFVIRIIDPFLQGLRKTKNYS
jgi:hypothetical protein